MSARRIENHRRSCTPLSVAARLQSKLRHLGARCLPTSMRNAQLGPEEFNVSAPTDAVCFETRSTEVSA